MCSIFIGTYLPMKMEQIECSETSAYKIQTPGNNPEENIQHSEHGESLKCKNYPNVNIEKKNVLLWGPADFSEPCLTKKERERTEE